MADVLIVGGGGREHALADALFRSPQVNGIWMTAQNGGTAAFTRAVPAADFADHTALADFCRRHQVDLVVVGPENHLADGIVNSLRAASVRVLGPTQQAARLESSKIYAKDFMRRYDIPTTAGRVCDDIAAVREWTATTSPPYVLKADGLAAGKGVEICAAAAAAETAAAAMLEGKYGAASRRLVLETFAAGEEMSFIVLAAGEDAVPLASSRDHKRLLDNDAGPNTGGMGVVSPAPQQTPALTEKIMQTVIRPALAGLHADGAPFGGFLYAGLMINGDDIRVLEFNCRFGDPEAQVVLPRLRGDFYMLCKAAADGNLAMLPSDAAQWTDDVAVGVVFAAAGYPESPRGGDALRLPPTLATHERIYHAGTKIKDGGGIVTSGGRVLTAVALAADQTQARAAAYDVARKVYFDGMQYRSDIAS